MVIRLYKRNRKDFNESLSRVKSEFNESLARIKFKLHPNSNVSMTS